MAYAPVVVATTAIAQSAIDAFDHEALDEQAALARFDEAVVVVAERLAVRASKVSGSAAEVLTATAGLARDKGLRSAVAKRVKAGSRSWSRCTAGSTSSRTCSPRWVA